MELRYDDLAFSGKRAAMPTISAKMEDSLTLSAELWPSRFLSLEERWALENAVGSSRSIRAHRDLISEKERPDSLFLIRDGWACRYTLTREGGRQLLALFLPGDFCNLDTLLFDRLNYGVRTLTPTTIAALPRDRAVALATEHPGVARMFTWLAFVENAILGEWALSLGRRSARERLAHLFCEVSARLGMKDANESSFDFPLTQEQIGDALGLTAVHVNRMMRILRADGLIGPTNRTMTIRNVAQLRSVCDFDTRYLHIE